LTGWSWNPGENDDRHVMRGSLRGACVALCVAVVVAACGGGEMSLTEYVDRIQAIFDRGLERYEPLVASPRGRVLMAEGAQLLEYTPRDLQAALEELGDIQAEALAAATDIDPPDDITRLHTLFFRRLPIEELAARAGTAADWAELSESKEMADYRAALAADDAVCAEFQAELNATAARGVFADNPWIPDEMTEIVEFALGCGTFVQNPEDLYRPPPTTVP
jgi:hypothetical protein